MFGYSTLIFENQENGCVDKKRVTSKFSYRHNKDNTASLHLPSYSSWSMLRRELSDCLLDVLRHLWYFQLDLIHYQYKYHILRKALMCDLIFIKIGANGTYVLVTSCLSYVGNVFVSDKGD